MRRWVPVFALILLGVVAGPVASAPVVAAPAGSGALRVDLDEILADPRLAGSHAGVVVRDPETDEVLYSRQPEARATPASTAKLFTAAAALEELGPDHRFRTEVRAAAPSAGPLLLGDLYLRGTGDPTMLAADYDRLAEQVAASGVRVVQGRLLTDDTWFDDVPLGTGWAWDDEPYYYAAPVSALTVAPNEDFDAGNVLLRVSPTTAGSPVRVDPEPATDAVRLDVRATTGEPGSESTLSVAREHGGDRVVVSGSVPADAEPAEEFTSVRDPSAYAADVFARALRAHGVHVAGTGEGVVPAGARAVAEHESMPLRELLVPFLKLSNNGHAEVLTKAMGRQARDEGSWPAGIEVLTERLAGLGVDPAALRLVDGSGLSSMDAVSPGRLASLLDVVRQRPWFADFHAALPVAAEPGRFVGGTLRNRMAGTAAAGNVHAKTGSISGVTTLSGYVTAANGRPLVFAVMFNDFLGDSPNDLEDAIAVRLAEYSGPGERPRGIPAVPRQNTAEVGEESDLECSWTKSC
ncbi:D-alanyl-D-alanine carboxypeptidase/D-alanyl-D-alanine-endopeptidase [Saccharopolyspora sp. NFXS83]|uniref:D-alanyl-D-alanine carboxypeptidase/D-alanyl-D-alanine endopeptidase n=1 Tax=Saccharopolyspora sp. NFXS83 TaxID=2993560 RepID=UPI00224B26DA|nr:D-alanyl-D-alanine carboxypeptidase/D-alanyl-D-alanine-endopeptidase [Saccharopolyspora sp. NFXS83]MCX2734137.1 D-alanyl-D-alanine carboxypeptidase/D-alanyl-D-alanine-endopeptidase [Saccharopolyspora sp. NFXS83]